MSNRGSVKVPEELAPESRVGPHGRTARPAGRRPIVKPDDLAAAIRRVMAARDLTTREVVKRVPRRHVGTVYRLLAGRTTDP